MASNDVTSVQSDARQAVVIGAGMAGLLAARVLSDYYEGVLVVERDVFPENLDPRAGTPQAFHVHRIIPRGKMIYERFFPGFIDGLLAAGAYATAGKSGTMVNPSGIYRFQSPEIDASYSRTLLEREVRQRVQALPNVRFLTGQEVLGLQVSPDSQSVTGVYLRERGQLEQRTAVNADLVIDASGRTSKLPQWLQELGYALPVDEQVNAQIGYSTRYYQATPEIVDRVGSMVVDAIPSEKRIGAGVLPIENDVICVTLFTVGGYYPPTDVAGFEEELTHLPLIESELADALQGTEPLNNPRGYRVPTCVRHHYEQADRWPAGLLCLGDSFCHFDPIYGQGMTVAAIEAETLAACLEKQRSQPQADFERKTFSLMQGAVAQAWWLSSVADLRGPAVTYEGAEQPQGTALIHRYLDLYFKYALEHPVEEAQVMISPQPTLVKFFMLNSLMIPPHTIFNVPTLSLLLEAETVSEEQVLHKLVDAYQLSPEEILAQIIPSFPFAFDILAMSGAM